MLVNGRVILKKPKSLKEKKVYIFQQTEVFKRQTVNNSSFTHSKKYGEKKWLEAKFSPTNQTLWRDRKCCCHECKKP